MRTAAVARIFFMSVLLAHVGRHRLGAGLGITEV
jgi:hypothetical protein